MVITDMRMENESAGLEVVRAAKQAPYQPAVAMLTAFPVPGSEWRDEGMDEMLVKPMNIMSLAAPAGGAPGDQRRQKAEGASGEVEPGTEDRAESRGTHRNPQTRDRQLGFS